MHRDTENCVVDKLIKIFTHFKEILVFCVIKLDLNMSHKIIGFLYNKNQLYIHN